MNIRKALFEVEKTILSIILMVVTVNLVINGLMVLLDDSITVSYIIQKLLLISISLGFFYLIIYAISNAANSLPFLVSLNCPGRLLSKNIIFIGLIRSILITLLFLLVKIIVLGMGFTSGSLAMNIFGLSLNSNDLGILSVLAGFICLALNFTYNLTTLISLLGVNYGWEYVLSAIFIILGSFFLFFKSILLLFVFGWNLAMFSLCLLILDGILILLNYRLIKNFENKY